MMKKINLFLLPIIIFSFNSCIDFEAPSNEISAPSINNDGGIITLTPQNISSAQYINIFRYEVSETAEAPEDTDPVYNIGQIIKTENYTNTGSVLFSDYFTDENKYYQYCIRYKTQEGYLYSKTSGTFKGIGKYATALGSDGAAELSATGSDPIDILYDGKSELLILKSDINIPTIPGEITDSNSDEPFDLCFSINNGSITLLFNTENYKDPSTSDEYFRLDLYKILPDNFFDKNLEFKSIAGVQKKQHKNGNGENEKIDYEIYNYTLPFTDFTIKYPEGVEKIYVSSEKVLDSNLDFTSNRIMPGAFQLQN